MRKLIRANFARLRHSKIFWLVLAGMFAFSACMVSLDAASQAKADSFVVLDYNLFTYAYVAPVLLSVLVALFVGNDYSSGTIRNKIVAGHKRSDIYFANLIVCISLGIALCFAFIVPCVAIGLLLHGEFISSLREIFINTALSMALIIAFSALFVLIAMLCQNKSHTVAGCILLSFALLLWGVYITSALGEPEYLPEYSYTENGVTVSEEATKNSNYIEGTTRRVYEFLQDFTPGSQALQVAGVSVKTPGKCALYNVAILIAATGVGTVIFRRKNLK